jgi:predicted nucleic acid-binding protein
MLYLDASAFIAALGAEERSRAARALLADRPAISSALLEVEVARVTAHADARLRELARERLGAVRLVEVDRAIIASAARLAPGVRLRTLDAIHLATALAIPTPVTMVTLDQRLLAASLMVGIAASEPGAPDPLG